MTSPTPPRGTQTTLRVLPRALLVGRPGPDGEALLRLVMLEGYLPTKQQNADDALAALRTASFALVLVHEDVTGMSASQFVEALRAEAELAHLPVLVAAATDGMEVVERCLECGADDYLPRTFGAAMLKARIGAALDRRRLQENEALRHEMTVARNIQRDFLPESLPTVRGMQLEALLHPARQVSGDFYDAFQLAPSGNLMIVVGDVRDTGVGDAIARVRHAGRPAPPRRELHQPLHRATARAHPQVRHCVHGGARPRPWPLRLCERRTRTGVGDRAGRRHPRAASDRSHTMI